jgi:hypothetical protein
MARKGSSLLVVGITKIRNLQSKRAYLLASPIILARGHCGRELEQHGPLLGHLVRPRLKVPASTESSSTNVIRAMGFCASAATLPTSSGTNCGGLGSNDSAALPL